MATRRSPDLLPTKTITATATGTTQISTLDSGVIFVSNTTTHTIGLPPISSAPAGTRFQFIKTTTATHAITLDGNASETINGATTYASMDAAYDSAEIVSNGTEWFICDAKIA